METRPDHKADTLHHRLIELRRTLHMHPELSGEERETAAIIASRLASLGLATQTYIGGYGVVGVLQGDHPGPTIAYRADMDALPLQETLSEPYASLRPSVSHACGHDVHTTIALGLAELLAESTDTLSGRVIFVFQPAEESLDGARAMIEDGLLHRYAPDAMLALHTFPLPTGSIGIALGPCLAGMEEFRVHLRAPADLPEKWVDEAVRRLEALSTQRAPTCAHGFGEVIRRMVSGDPELSRTIYISSWPVAPGDTSLAQILGLVSLPDIAMRPQVRALIEETLAASASGFGGSYDIEYTFSSPPLQNDRTLVQRIIPTIERVVGAGGVRRFLAPYPFAHEDFARFAENVPAALIWLGTQNLDRAISSIPHTPDYDVDEDALLVGVEVMAAVVRQLMEPASR